MNEIIKEMIRQFCVNPNRLVAMIGAKNFSYDNKNNAFNFHFKMCKKANICTLEYDSGLDLYNMKFHKYNSRTCDIKTVEIMSGLYNDQLKEVFENYTGLYISL